jgi:serine/threonine-protein kinase
MSSTPPAPALVPGQLLDRYELLCPIAQGGMAQVWVARLQGKLGFEKLVAIKTLVGDHSQDDRFEKMFLDEANIISKIRHPNVAQILDLGQQGGVLFLVLEWIEGDSVAALRRAAHGKGEKIPLNIVLRVVSDACSGLHSAHELRTDGGEPLNVVHRDVSPSNVLVSTSGEVKLIDFGVAKAVERISPETAAGVIKGKVAYMSPEQALGKAVDRRADVWSLGIMLYHLLAGRTPYEAENQIATLHRVVQGLPPDPISGIPPEVAEIAYTSLSYAANGRFASADEMQRALDQALIKCCGPTTQADVAAYANAKLAERLARRKRTIARALEAAEQRRELAQEFETAIEQSSSSLYAAMELKTPSSMQALPRSTAESDAALDALLDEGLPSAAEPQEPPAPAPAAPPAERLRLELPAPDLDSPAFSEAPTLKKPPANLPNLPVPVSVARAPGPLPPMPRPPASDRPPPPSSGAEAPLPPIPREVPTEASSERLADAKTQPAARLKLPPEPVITTAEDGVAPREMLSIPDTSKFGTRRRGPLVVVGFAVAVAVLGYGAYLAWDKMNTERTMAPAPP